MTCPQGHRLPGGAAAFCDICGAALGPGPNPVRAGRTASRRTAVFVAAAAIAVLLAVASAVFFAMAGDDGDAPASAISTAVLDRSRPGSTGTARPLPSAGAAGPGATAGATAPTASTVVPGDPSPGSTAASAAPAATTSGAGPQATTAAPTETPSPAELPTPVPPTPVPPPPNLAANGGFESGSLSAPWGTGIYEPRAQGVFWGSADAEAAVVSDVTHSGSYALRIVNRSAAAPNVYRTLSQKVAVQGGAQHCLTFWERTQNGTPGMLTFRLNDSWGSALGIGAGSASWAQRAFTFTAEDGNIDLRIVSENTGTAWVDDIVLTAGACAVANGLVPPGASPR